MFKSNKKNNFIWACDLSKNTGEGQLANLFLDKEKLNINKCSCQKINNRILQYKYILPLVGVFFCWVNFFKKKKYIILITYRFGTFLFYYFYRLKR